MIWIFTPEIAAPEGSKVLPISAPVEGDRAPRWFAKQGRQRNRYYQSRKPAASPQALGLMHAATHKYPLATLLENVVFVVVFAPCGGRE